MALNDELIEFIAKGNYPACLELLNNSSDRVAPAVFIALIDQVAMNPDQWKQHKDQILSLIRVLIPRTNAFLLNLTESMTSTLTIMGRLIGTISNFIEDPQEAISFITFLINFSDSVYEPLFFLSYGTQKDIVTKFVKHFKVTESSLDGLLELVTDLGVLRQLANTIDHDLAKAAIEKRFNNLKLQKAKAEQAFLAQRKVDEENLKRQMLTDLRELKVHHAPEAKAPQKQTPASGELLCNESKRVENTISVRLYAFNSECQETKYDQKTFENLQDDICLHELDQLSYVQLADIMKFVIAIDDRLPLDSPLVTEILWEKLKKIHAYDVPFGRPFSRDYESVVHLLVRRPGERSAKIAGLFIAFAPILFLVSAQIEKFNMYTHHKYICEHYNQSLPISLYDLFGQLPLKMPDITPRVKTMNTWLYQCANLVRQPLGTEIYKTLANVLSIFSHDLVGIVAGYAIQTTSQFLQESKAQEPSLWDCRIWRSWPGAAEMEDSIDIMRRLLHPRQTAAHQQELVATSTKQGEAKDAEASSSAQCVVESEIPLGVLKLYLDDAILQLQLRIDLQQILFHLYFRQPDAWDFFIQSLEEARLPRTPEPSKVGFKGPTSASQYALTSASPPTPPTSASTGLSATDATAVTVASAAEVTPSSDPSRQEIQLPQPAHG